jgi:CHAT domain-containing protein
MCIRLIFLIFINLLGNINFLSGQNIAAKHQKIITDINLTIVKGKESSSDSLIRILSVDSSFNPSDVESSAIIQTLRGLHCAYFHYDYALDSLFSLRKKSSNQYVAHIQKLIETEYYFNNADWERVYNLGIDFAIEELSLDSTAFNTLFYTVSLSNVIIGRDNLLLAADSLVIDKFNQGLRNLLNDSINSLNNAILIKLYWASSIVNSTSRESNELKGIIWDKLLLLSNEDLIYFETVISTYALESSSFYDGRKNIEIYREFSEYFINNNKCYFISNKWFLHLLKFGLFGDSGKEKEYFDIEYKYHRHQKKVSPYFVGQRLVHYGIFNGNKNNSLSKSFFSKFFYLLECDSTFNSINRRLFNNARYYDAIYNFSFSDKMIIKLVENENLISQKNSNEINTIYSVGYINELAYDSQFGKIDSLFKFNATIASNKIFIRNNSVYELFEVYDKLRKSFSQSNYVSFKREFVRYEHRLPILNLTRYIPNLIEYATYFDDVVFADYLLGKYYNLGVQKFQKVFNQRVGRSELNKILNEYYIERSFVNLFNKTQDTNYLIRLFKFKLLKDALVFQIVLNENTNKLIDSVERAVCRDDLLKAFKYITNTFDYANDYNYFERKKVKNHLILDSLYSAVESVPQNPFDTSTIISSCFEKIDDSSIILFGLAARKHPEDVFLSTYVLAIEKDLDKINLITVEDTIFNTPLGNYFEPTRYPYSRKDKFKYLIGNLDKSLGIQALRHQCESKKDIRIKGEAMIDQIPFNLIFANDSSSKSIYNISFLYSAKNTTTSEEIDKQNSKMLLVGGAKFSTVGNSTSRNIWSYLPGSLDEVKYIKAVADRNYQCTLLTDSNATKSNLVYQLTNSRYKIVHMATHSLYADFDSTKSPFAKIPVSILPHREARSAILLAGGGDFDKFESSERLDNFLQMNLLLGEVMFLPLKQTDLVVLSSCETNLGIPMVYKDYYGNITLNTAFKYAGAKYVIGTRWEVSDTYSKKFYEDFYTNLNEGSNIEQSFFYAVAQLKKLNSDPFVWGAYMLNK